MANQFNCRFEGQHPKRTTNANIAATIYKVTEVKRENVFNLNTFLPYLKCITTSKKKH